VLPLYLNLPTNRPLSLLAIGAHPDDIEIGAGGTLLALAKGQPGLKVHYLVLTGTPERQLEARAAADAFLPGAELSVELHNLPEGRLPAIWGTVKEVLEAASLGFSPDLVLAPSCEDAHQDHRTIAEIVPTVYRNSLYLAYEIPKWDGDLGRPSVFVPLSSELAHRKVELLHKSFPSQHSRDWWDDEVFLGLARLRGMECRTRYAEAFSCTKAVLMPLARNNGQSGVGDRADSGTLR
jgi:LmbE family N-acetylglucosaminyl deacetylase